MYTEHFVYMSEFRFSWVSRWREHRVYPELTDVSHQHTASSSEALK
jgi:hypothetical protein